MTTGESNPRTAGPTPLLAQPTVAGSSGLLLGACGRRVQGQGSGGSFSKRGAGLGFKFGSFARASWKVKLSGLGGVWGRLLGSGCLASSLDSSGRHRSRLIMAIWDLLHTKVYTPKSCNPKLETSNLDPTQNEP